MAREKKWGRFDLTEDAQEVYDSAVSEIEDVQTELQDWLESMQGTNLENSRRVEEIDSAIPEIEEYLDSLSDLSEDLQPFLKNKKVTYKEFRKANPTKGNRFNNAIYKLWAVVQLTEEGKEEALDEISSELVDCIDGLESVSFPGR